MRSAASNFHGDYPIEGGSGSTYTRSNTALRLGVLSWLSMGCYNCREHLYEDARIAGMHERIRAFAARVVCAIRVQTWREQREEPAP